MKVHIVDEVGMSDGCEDGDSDGCEDGDSDGCEDGDNDGCADDSDGCADDSDGCADGDSDGCEDGDSDGCADSDSDGCVDGDSDGCGDSSYYFLLIFHSTLPQHGQTPLHYATAQGKVDVAKRLRFHHADVYFRNKVGVRLLDCPHQCVGWPWRGMV